MKSYYDDGQCVIYHGDCLEIAPLLSAEVVISDPPYGMNWDGKVTRGRNGTGKAGPTRHFGQTIANDSIPFDPAVWLRYRGCVLWGFHHFANRLPKGSVLIWIKRHDSAFGSFLSDADLAWMKGGEGVYCKRDVSLQGESRFRVHPTQKPEPVMAWCIEKASSQKDKIIDPFMGSGTTLVAAKRLGRKAVGIEIEEKYCEIAAKRLAQGALDLFGEQSA
jgi:site-specific DNA-methyltransferase (adenine-specific)